jgi:hypothetical protein
MYADDPVLVTTSRRPSLLVTYLETYLKRLQNWLRGKRIAINVSNSIAALFAKAVTHPTARISPVLEQPIQ